MPQCGRMAPRSTPRRFETSEMGDVWTELCAYGTAVVAIPVTEGAKETPRQLGYGAAAS
jgi:hypothetical protein